MIVDRLIVTVFQRTDSTDGGDLRTPMLTDGIGDGKRLGGVHFY
jgi:hypothetical protein